MQQIRCSKLARVMTCAGSIFFDEPEETTNDAAKEGTACGELLAAILTTQDTNHPMTVASNGVQIDDDMRFYTSRIADTMFQNAATPILCETRIDWETRSGILIRGSYDASYVGKDGKLYIEDLKYGWGIVEVKENWQLLGYAIGEIMRRGVPHDVVLRIRQPRPHHEDGDCREWHLPYAELLEWKEKIDARFDLIASGDKTLVTSKQCKYCPASGEECPSLSKTFFKSVETVHEFIKDSLRDDELSFQLDLISRVEEVIKIKKDSLSQLAINRIKSGSVIPGYITESRYGDRKWKKGITPQALEMMTGRKVIEESVISPAKLEKMGIPKEVVETMTERFFLGNKVVKKSASDLADKVFGKPKKEG